MNAGYKVFLRAADVSPLITERTLGSDLEIVENNETIVHATPKRQQKLQQQSQEPINPAKIERSSYAHLPQIGSARLLDYETIKLNVSMRSEQIEANKIRKAIKSEILKEHVRETEFLQKKKEERLRSIQDEHEKLVLKKQHDDKLISQKAEEHALQSEEKDQREIEAIHIQTRRTMRLVVFNGISQCQEFFRDKYSAVIKLLLACQRTDYNKSLKDLIEQFEQLIIKLKNNDYGPTELKTAQRICESLEDLEHKIIAEIEELIKESERQREEELQHHQQRQQQQQQQLQQQQQQQEQLRQQQELNEQLIKVAEEEKAQAIAEGPNQVKAPEINNTANQNSEVIPTQFSDTKTIDDGLNTYSNIISYYQSVVEKVKPLKNDESLKKYRFACQKAINIPINAISAVSPQHLQDKLEKLYRFINGQPSNDVRSTDHPLGRDYCLLLTAKKFVSQGSTAVSSNQQAAFPIAAVMISLWKLIPEIGQLFLAYIYKESPYMVPFFLRQQEGQSSEDYLKQLGYHFTNGQIESNEIYLKRQAGITRLYAACIVTNGRQSDGPYHPHGLRYAWLWLTKFFCLEPRRELSATIIMEFLQIVSAPMLRTYGKQFIKLLDFIQRVYYPQLDAIDEGGPKTRLKLQLDKFRTEGRIDLPIGMLPPGYW